MFCQINGKCLKTFEKKTENFRSRLKFWRVAKIIKFLCDINKI